MRLGVIFLVLLFAGFTWSLWQGIDLATNWLEQAEMHTRDSLTLNEAEYTVAEPSPVSPPATSEVNESTGSTPTRAPETGGTTSPLEAAQDLVTEVPTGIATTGAVLSGVPMRTTARPHTEHEVAPSEPVSPAPQEPAPQSKPAPTPVSSGATAPETVLPRVGAEAPTTDTAASHTAGLDPSVNMAVEPPATAPSIIELMPDTAAARLQVPAAPEPDIERPATELANNPTLTDEPAQPAQTEALQCNLERCAAAFRSFQASDCTYQPFEGPRQLCPYEAVGANPSQPSIEAAPAQTEALQCNFERCAAAFRSFQASNCTYQPFEGPRQLCRL